MAWRLPVGRGHSAVSVQGGRGYTMGWDGTNDTVFCIDVQSGAIRWQRSYPCRGIGQWSGPRATPTVDGNRVYTLGQHGQLRAWDCGPGKLLWAVDLPATYQPDVDYGFSWSPLIANGLVILGTGSRGLALRKDDGEFAWGNDGQAGACASPVPFVSGGQPGVALVAMDPSRQNVSVVGVEAKTGRELWRFGPWPEKWGAACADLLVGGNRVFLSTAEQHKRCVQFSFESGMARERWSNRNLSTYTGNVILIRDHLYGVDKTGILKCVKWEDGEERWAQRGFGEFGTLIGASDKLLVQSGKQGVLTVVAAEPSAFRELGHMTVFTGPPQTFTAPVLSNGRIFCRSYEGEVVCVDLTRK